MKLRGIDFGHVWQASGATNFYGQGWWYHHPLRPLGLDFSGATFVAKTTTLLPRKGNMPLKKDGVTPQERFPKSIYVNLQRNAAVNAVSLSGPGLVFLLNSGEWQKRTEPFFISLMSTESTLEKKVTELYRCCEILNANKKDFQAPFGVQVNVSCPNIQKVKHPIDTHQKNGETDVQPNINQAKANEIIFQLLSLGTLGVPLVAKLGPNTPPEVAALIAESGACDALHIFNTIPWDDVSIADRLKYFGTITSPLVKRLGTDEFHGGVSGKPLHKILSDWLPQFRELNPHFPVNAGGGILSPYDAGHLFDIGADGVSLGSIAFLAPWKVKKTIKYAHVYGAQTEKERSFSHASVSKRETVTA